MEQPIDRTFKEAPIVTSTWVKIAGTWYHIAIELDSEVVFVDGEQQ